MEIKNVYPTVGKKTLIRRWLTLSFKWVFLFAALICGVINLAIGGKAWSVVVIWSLWMVWTQFVNPDLVEYNRISQTIKFIVNSCILLGLIDLILAPGWSVKVISIICFSALILVSVLFFTDYRTQRQNMFPMLIFSLFCIIGSVIGLVARQNEDAVWTLTVTAAVAFFLLLFCALNLGRDFLTEMKKRFSVK